MKYFRFEKGVKSMKLETGYSSKRVNLSSIFQPTMCVEFEAEGLFETYRHYRAVLIFTYVVSGI